jgi:hypothetical protein
MPATFDKMGIAFQYPENWTLDEEDAVTGRHSVTIYSPGGGFWTVAMHPPGMGPAELVRAAVSAMRQEYEEVEREDIRQTLAGHDLVGCDLNFFYLDLTNTACIRGLRVERATVVIFYQAEDREFVALRPVFEAMTLSLVRGFGAPLPPGEG